MPAGVSSDLADRVAELGMLLGFLSSTDDLAEVARLLGLDPSVVELLHGLLSGFLSSADDLAEAHLLGLKHPEGTASGS